MVDNALIYVNLILAYSLCGNLHKNQSTIDLPLNLFPFPRNYFPWYSSPFQFLIIALPLCGESPESLQISFPSLGTHQLLSSSANGLSSKSGRKWVTADQIPIVSLVMVGWREKPLKRESFPKDVREVKKKSFWKLAKWLWHWALSLWPSVVSLSVRSATIFPPRPEY